MPVRTAAVTPSEDLQPRCDAALLLIHRPSVCFRVAPCVENTPDASVRLLSIRFCVSPVFYLPNLSSSPSALPPPASRLSRLPSSFHSSPIPIFNLYPRLRRHHSHSASPVTHSLFSLLSLPLHPLKLHY